MRLILGNKFFFPAILIFTLLFWTIPSIFSQEHTGKGRIRGIVVDEKGQPVEGALVLV